MSANSYIPGTRNSRPWGEWLVLDSGDGYAVKRIIVHPGGCLSLQRHSGRDEHWVVVSGLAKVTRDNETFDVTANGAVFIPAHTMHRVANPGAQPLVLIEVQSGTYLDELDIERFDDIYGRT